MGPKKMTREAAMAVFAKLVEDDFTVWLGSVQAPVEVIVSDETEREWTVRVPAFGLLPDQIKHVLEIAEEHEAEVVIAQDELVLR